MTIAERIMKNMITRTKERIKTRDITVIAFFVALTAICAQIAIPMPGGVPMSLQTWAVLFSGIFLGSKKGALAILIYVLLGAIGIPVFANFGAGIGRILGPGGGFILSFPLMSYIAGLGLEVKAEKKSKIILLVALTTAIIANFLCGMVFFTFIMEVSFGVAFATVVLPFIPLAVIEIIVILGISDKLRGLKI